MLEQALIQLCLVSLFVATLLYWIPIVLPERSELGSLGIYGMLVANGCATALLAERWVISGHLPLSNLYESCVFLTWSLTCVHLALRGKRQPHWLGALAAPSAMLTETFAALTTGMQPSRPLVPALQSNWLLMHVSMMIMSYGALLFGCLLALTLLVVSSVPLPHASPFRPGAPGPASSEALDLRSGTCQRVALWSLERAFFEARRLALLAQLDFWSYRSIGIGFPLLTMGIVSGAVWANEAWGAYWSWDPKETWALITWFIFAVYLHARIGRGWAGTAPALVASFGLLVVWACYLGVNLLGEGLHSYGWLH